MALDKKTNEYGTFLFKEYVESNSRANGRAIIYLHDQYDNPDVFNEFAEQLKYFDYYSFALPGDDLYENDGIYKNSFNFSCRYVRDLILSLNATSVNIIAHGTTAPIAMFLANVLHQKITKVCLINPFCSKASIETIKWVSTLPRNIRDMYKVMQRMFYKDDQIIFARKEKSIPVISRMRNVFNHFTDISNYVENITTVKILDELRLYEENVKCPVALILGEDDEWIQPQESLLSFNNSKLVRRIQIPHAKHYPLHDKKDATIKYLMRFFIEDSGLYDANRLPNKYIYDHLSDEWKNYYRNTFSDKLSARDQEEYNNKLNEYEKANATIKFVNEEYPEYINEYVQNQTTSLDSIYHQVEENYHRTKSLEAEYEKANQKTVEFDLNMPANQVAINNQGYEVYHDGKGHGYYRDNFGNWKKINLKK